METILSAKQQIMEDIEQIHTNDDQRNSFYYFLNEKSLYNRSFKNLVKFLKGNMNLESVSDNLQTLTKELKRLR